MTACPNQYFLQPCPEIQNLPGLTTQALIILVGFFVFVVLVMFWLILSGSRGDEWNAI